MVNLKLVCRAARDVAIATNFCWILFRELHKICISAVLSTELVRWTQAASGADGRVNVGLCAASSLSRKRFVLPTTWRVAAIGVPGGMGAGEHLTERR